MLSAPLVACVVSALVSAAAPLGPPSVSVPWRVPAPLATPHGSHANTVREVREAECAARWGREMGPVLCPALTGEREGEADKEVEVRLLGALWHVARDQVASWAGASARAVVGAWRQLGPLVQEEAL